MASYKYLTEQESVDRLLPTLMSRENWAVDTETTGLCPIDDKVILFQIGTETEQYVIDTRKVSLEPLRPFFESTDIKKYGHNLKFDYRMTKGSFGLEMESLRDSFIAEKLLFNGLRFDGFGLKDCIKRYLDITLEEKKELQKSFIGHTGDFSEAQLEYAATDTQHILPMMRKQYKEMQSQKLVDTWFLECSCIPCFGDMELYGVLLDQHKWSGIMAENLEKAREIERRMDELSREFCDLDLFGNPTINYNSPEQIVKLLVRMKMKIESRGAKGETIFLVPTKSDEETLKKLKRYPFVGLLDDYRHYLKLSSTYGQPYLSAVHPKTGRVHPDFAQMGTETGRPASGSSKVNLLNIPREKRFRQCFLAPEGYLIETDDFSGCELRIWAHISQDPQLCHALNEGKDLHCYVASKLYNKNVTKTESAELRTPAKSLNFGIAYGMGPMKLYNQLNGQGFPITLEQARSLYDKYCKEFKVGVNFLRNSGKKAFKEGYLANLNGRRRNWRRPNDGDAEKFPLGNLDPEYLKIKGAIEREGGNFLIQSVNADITKLAMINIRNIIKKRQFRSNLMLQVYDEIVTCTHENDSEEFHREKVRIMIDSARRWINSVPIEVDGHVLKHWTK